MQEDFPNIVGGVDVHVKTFHNTVHIKIYIVFIHPFINLSVFFSTSPFIIGTPIHFIKILTQLY